jgi:RNA polymerase-binding transcription factor DksA
MASTKAAAKTAPKGPLKSGTKKYLEHFEGRLREERKRVLKDLGFQEGNFDGGDTDSSAYSFHMADQGTDAMEREKAFLFASKEGRYLWHIDQALRRLYKHPDAFGKCHQCGNEIPFERLDVMPNARYCINCKQLEEREKQK